MALKEAPIAIPTCVVFGTNPANDLPDSLFHEATDVPAASYWRQDEGERADRAVREIQKGTQTMICVGGETFLNSAGKETTEASSMLTRILDEAYITGVDVTGVRFLMAEEGKETLAQVEQVIRILSQYDLVHGAIGIISSWHQIPRIRYILKEKAGISSEPLVANRIGMNARIFSHTWNYAAGLGYTALALEMQKRGMWVDGGPIIHKYRINRS